MSVSAADGASAIVGFCLDGCATIWLGDEPVTLSAGNALTFMPGDHTLQFFSDTTLLTVRVPVGTSGLLSLASQRFKTSLAGERTLSQTDSADIFRLATFACEEIDRSLLGGSNASLMVRALATRIRTALASKLPPSAEESSGRYQICLSAHRHLLTNLHSHVSLNELAHAACCSLRQLHRAFDEVVGITPADFVARVQLRHIRSEIVAGARLKPMNRTQSRAYEREFGETPAETLEVQRRRLDAILGEKLASK